jgi:DNA-directed RNA polymerase specialized sigma subunit
MEKEKEVKAMEKLFIPFKPLLKSRAKRYSRIGLEYENVFQQATLIFILAVYDYTERPPTTFAAYIKKLNEVRTYF